MITDFCFYCRNQTDDSQCRLGLMGDQMKSFDDCPKFDPRIGFQMGGYYTHMWFETDDLPADENDTPCLTWHIQGDLEFPHHQGQPPTEIHICDFTQIEEWVKFWGAELRKRGWVKDD